MQGRDDGEEKRGKKTENGQTSSRSDPSRPTRESVVGKTAICLCVFIERIELICVTRQGEEEKEDGVGDGEGEEEKGK